MKFKALPVTSLEDATVNFEQTQPLLNDLAVVKEAPLNVEWAPYNASPAVADNSAAIQGAVNALPSNGGELFFPRRYTTSGQITLTGKTSVCIRGVGGMSGGAATGSGVKYTGSAGSFISAQGISGFEISDMQVLYNNAGFSGTLIDLSSGSSDIVVQRSRLGGAGITTSTYLVNLDGIAGDVAFRDVSFGNSSFAVLGRSISAHFSNAVLFEGGSFQNTVNPPILNPGEGWSFLGVTFEPLTSGAAGAIASTMTGISGMTIHGCWFGDANTTAATWIDLPLLGSTITGNFIGGNTNTTAINLQAGSAGVVAAGNMFDTHLNAFGLAGGGARLTLTPNHYSGVTNIIAAGAGTLAQVMWDGGASPGAYINATQIHTTDGVGTKVGTTTALTSAQIDALFTVAPLDGYVLVDSANVILLYRANGKWYKIAGTLIP